MFQENNKNDEVDVDIDELLDMDDDNQRRIHLQVSRCGGRCLPACLSLCVDLGLIP